jgi:predicted O-linked N-acetylglucosamine transferase (SPINDLY family)
MLPGIILPGLGECWDLPELPITPTSGTPTLGCLTPAIRIGPDGWRLFAQVLQASPESQLLLNLKDLGDSAQAYITRQFAQSGIAASRLRFVHAHTREELCHYWQEVQLGLAPPVDAGDQALNTCLWMGRPFVALAASLPWSHRPAALLHCAGASAWVADSATHYVELASRPPRAPDPGLRKHLRAAGLNDPSAFARRFAATMADLMQAAHATRPSP